MHFTKMHGLGNDYLYVYGTPHDPEALAVRLSERHFGAGSDGMIWIEPSDKADFKMRIFNADGSEAAMCGNGIRCVGKYVYDKGYTDKTELTIETMAGLRRLWLSVSEGHVDKVRVDMGCAKVSEDLAIDVGDASRVTMDDAVMGEAASQAVCLTPVSVGNPHAVLFVSDAEKAPVTMLGPVIEHHSAFSGGVNVEFVSLAGKNHLRMRVWERGSGVTMACGTGACASAAAAVARGLCQSDSPIAVTLDGGTLNIEITKDGTVYMTGPAETVYEGEVELC